ncbi:MAG: Gfo/Idh/MocA family oxidoreductase [Opitutaceae bacterium]|nr:Gfo/Idh/MocA family oxidoreductase [Opitutaceae bacterium]
MSPFLRCLSCLGLCLMLFLPSTRAANPRPPARGKVIIDRTSFPWESQQVQEPCILPNPKDPTRLVMFYSGVPAANRRTCYIGKAWALKSDPMTWHQDPDNPVLIPAPGNWDSGSIRLDAVLYLPEEDAYYLYYSGTTSVVQDQIGLAICPAGADGYSGISTTTIRRHGNQPVLAPEPAAPYFENMASQAAVWREWNATEKQWDWTLYYSYRGKDGTLPGIRLATSRDGKTWTRQFNDKDPRGMGQIFESTPDAYYEWHQVFKIDDTYLLSIEVGISRGKRWRPVIAVSKHPRQGWRQTNVDTLLQTKWEGLYRDDTIYHVATPAFYSIEDKWYLYTQACPLPANGNYIDGHWDMWGFPCDQILPTLPGFAGIPSPGHAPDPGIRVGIVGLDTSHAVAFTQALNSGPKNPADVPRLAGARVVAAVAQGSRDIESSTRRVPEYTQKVKAQGVEVVPTLADLLPRVDAVLLESNDGRVHLEQLLPILQTGKPVFVDKPIAGSLVDTVRILDAARQAKVPLFCSSSLRFTPATQAVRNGSLGRVSRVETYSPAHLEPHHPDLYWYGVHGCESLFTVLGTGCESVRRTTTSDGLIEVVGTWSGGRVGIFRQENGKDRKGYGGIATGEKGTAAVGGYEGYDALLGAIVDMFRTGKVPVSPDETLELYAFMEAADESARRGGAEVTLKEVLAKARAAVAARP